MSRCSTSNFYFFSRATPHWIKHDELVKSPVHFISIIYNIFSPPWKILPLAFAKNDDDFFTDDSGFRSIAIGLGAAPCSTFSCPLLWCFLVEVDMSGELEQIKFVNLSMCIYTKTLVDQAKEEVILLGEGLIINIQYKSFWINQAQGFGMMLRGLWVCAVGFPRFRLKLTCETSVCPPALVKKCQSNEVWLEDIWPLVKYSGCIKLYTNWQVQRNFCIMMTDTSLLIATFSSDSGHPW